MSVDVLLGLGSNLGYCEGQLQDALGRLAHHGFATVARSSLYLTEPVEAPPQDWFVNAVVRGTTDLSVTELLQAAMRVEQELGRERQIPRSPRTMDVDILLYGDLVYEDPTLVVPHPRMHRRRFVLVPAAEIAPEMRHPGLERTIAELLAQCGDPSAVRPLRPAESWT